MKHSDKYKEAAAKFLRAWAQIIVKAWVDDSFKKHLLHNPKDVIPENVKLPGVEVYKIHENTNKVIHLVLDKDHSKELSDQDLTTLYPDNYLHGGVFGRKKNVHDDKTWVHVTKKAWTDSHFKERLLKHPHAALEEFGFKVPEGITYHVHENTDKVMHMSIPEKPSEILAEEDLKMISAGSGGGYYYSKVCSTAASASP